MKLDQPLILRIRQAHERCKRGSLEAIQAAVNCGALLLELRSKINNGDWTDNLDAIGIKKTTAWNYMKLAEKWDLKKSQLRDGIYFCNLLREDEFDLLPALQGGGRRLGKEELARRQLVFHFEEFARGLKEVSRFDAQNPFEGIEDDQLRQVRNELERTLALVDRALVKPIDT